MTEYLVVEQKEGFGRAEVRESTPMTDYLLFRTKRRIRTDRSERVKSYDRLFGMWIKKKDPDGPE